MPLTNPWTLLQGDSALMLDTIPDASVDAAIMDPPSGIGMFGKGWDKDKGGRDRWIHWLEGIMSQCLRTLKPGGHCAVWALPRTAHWTTTAIEDAGFEIRERIHDLVPADQALATFVASLNPDQQEALARIIDGQASPVLMHLFGNGFPKSLDIAKAIEKAAGVQPVSEEPASLGMAANADWNRLEKRLIMPPLSLPEALAWEGWGTALRPAAEHWIIGRKPVDTTTCAELRAATGWDHYHNTAGITAAEAKKRGWPKGSKRRTAKALHAGAIGMVEVVAPDGTLLDQQTLPFAPFTLKSTLANVLKHGVGAYNIDTCRVGTDAGWSYPGGKGGTGCFAGDGGLDQAAVKAAPIKATKGRHPAHLRLHHAIGCKQVGTTKVRTGTAVRHRAGGENFGGGTKPPLEDLGYAGADGTEEVDAWECVPACPVGGLGDKARFYPVFYTPKPSKKEKDAGCGEMAEKAWRGDAKNCTPRSGQIFEQVGRVGAPRRNSHPTVKAVKLMTWLIRLLAPKGGTVLDPFAGSGTTGVGCAAEGVRFIGIEQKPAYAAIAAARLSHAYDTPATRVPVMSTPPPTDPALEGFI